MANTIVITKLSNGNVIINNNGVMSSLPSLAKVYQRNDLIDIISPEGDRIMTLTAEAVEKVVREDTTEVFISDLNTLFSELSTFFFKLAGGSSNPQGSKYLGTFTDYDDLVANLPTANFGDFANVEQPQGASWKTFWTGGTYRPEGTYYWTGSEWSSNVKLISDELQKLNDEKLDKFNTIVVVKGLSDLPTLSGSKYPLLTNTTYLIDTPLLSIAGNYFEMKPGTVVRSLNRSNIVSYTGANFAAVGLNTDGAALSNFTIDAPNALFGVAFEDTVAGVSTVTIERMTILNCDTGIDTKNTKSTSIIDCVLKDTTTAAMCMRGIENGKLVIKGCTFEDFGTYAIDLHASGASAAKNIQVFNNELIAVSGTFIRGNVNSLNILPGGGGLVFENVVPFTIAGLVSVSTKDFRWWFIDNRNSTIPNSQIYGNMKFFGNALITSITNLVFTDVQGVGIGGTHNERYDIVSAATSTMTARNVNQATLTAKVTFTARTTGGFHDYLFTLAKNGTPLPDDFEEELQTDNSTRTFNIPVSHVTGDVYKLVSQGIGTSQDIIVEDLEIIIS